MKKLNLALFTLIFCSSTCFANFAFDLNNKVDNTLTLVSHQSSQGHLTLPSFIDKGALNVHGVSTSNNDMSKGSFAYGLDSSNYCKIKYNQDWGFSGTFYKVEITQQVGNIICFVSQDEKHRSHVTVNYFKM